MQPRFKHQDDDYILIGQSNHEERACDVYISKENNFIRIVWNDEFGYETRELLNVIKNIKKGTFLDWAISAYQIGVDYLEDPSIVESI